MLVFFQWASQKPVIVYWFSELHSRNSCSQLILTEVLEVYVFLILFVLYPVTLQQPNISLTCPNGGLVWSPEGAEVIMGYSFIITCSISPHYPGGLFSLIFSGSNITDTQPAVQQSASFTFPVAEDEHQGSYSCVYEVTLSSKKFTSETEQISVVIKCK